VQNLSANINNKYKNMIDRRPDYPNCVMTPEVIRGVQERQRAWDREHPEESKKYNEENN
jgi:hypothetical protein